MEIYYPYVVGPLAAMGWLICLTSATRLRGEHGLTAYSGAIAFWATTLLLGSFPSTAQWATRMAASGAFVAAGYLHAAYDLTGARRRWLIHIAYLVATIITAAGAIIPGLLYDPVSLSPGPLFWPSMGLAVLAASVPLVELRRAYLAASTTERRPLQGLFFAGFVGYVGAWTNAVMLAHGLRLPWGVLLVIASLMLLSGVVRLRRPAHERRILERSLLYSALAAILSSGVILGVLAAVDGGSLLSQYGAGALFLLAMAVVAVEPLRQRLQEVLAARIAPNSANIDDLARELAHAESKAHHAQRLAEIGALTAAIAHEVRNPLGVISANLRLLERGDADPEVLDELRDQVARANDFVDDLLAYGRPRPLNIREIDLAGVISLAESTARQALSEAFDTARFTFRFDQQESLIEADQAQLVQVFVGLFENAMLAMEESSTGTTIDIVLRPAADTLTITVSDDGPGIAPEVSTRLFEPFVTSRKRGGPRAGSGLGLAIALSVLERHGGSITTRESEGATFVITLPRQQKILSAAQAGEIT